MLILSHGYWQRSFGGDPSVVGRVFRMNDRPHQVVGVLPPVPQYPVEVDVYMPTSACPFRSDPQMVENRGRAHGVGVRRGSGDGVTLETGAGRHRVVAARLQQEYPEVYPGRAGYRRVARRRCRRS